MIDENTTLPTMQEETHLFTSDDKKKWWDYGEWIEEPDEVKFTYKNYKCLIRRIAVPEPYATDLCMFGGHLCGYVEIPISHYCFNKNYNEINIDVHGGLTYSEMNEKNEYWIGFDCAHSEDYMPSSEKLKRENPYQNPFPISEKFKKYSMFNPIYRNIDFCVKNCMEMIDQLIEIEKKDKLNG